MARWSVRPAGAGSDGVAVRLPGWVRELLASQAGQLADLVGGGAPGAAAGAAAADPDDPFAGLRPPERAPAPPQDEVLARLFPSAYDESEAEAAGEFRRLTEGDLRAGVLARAHRLAATAGEEHLSGADARAWLLAVNDLRLALGARLGLRTDHDAERLMADAPAGSPVAVALQVQASFGHVQSLLVEALDAIDARRPPPYRA